MLRAVVCATKDVRDKSARIRNRSMRQAYQDRICRRGARRTGAAVLQNGAESTPIQAAAPVTLRTPRQPALSRSGLASVRAPRMLGGGPALCHPSRILHWTQPWPSVPARPRRRCCSRAC
ncbi:hypothetical protein LUTEI9C_60127 [Luteimonas sp. 9C]|nr:hypothetical protein LUTEI9C_60127 [Luteimonas sp. 9C]